jgi:ammonium transporter, Amt family
MPAFNSGDTAWLLVSCALVMLMIPGLALFYGGMVQTRNVLSTFMHSMFALGIVTIQWVVIGYSLAFGESFHGLVGGLNHAFLDGVALTAEAAKAEGGTPPIAFVMFQGMFAIITPALISGAFAERIKFSAYCLFTLLWATLVYDPVAHWVWGSGGWLADQGKLDFAGGTVVHLSSGISALVVALMIGKRTGYPSKPYVPHNMTMTLLGAGLLWFGWFGFNAGSALEANGTAALALANTQIAAACGAVAWGLADYIRHKRVTALGVASGLVAGLVGITPAAGFVEPMAAIAIGGIAGVVCFAAVVAKTRLGYDDALDAFGIHGVGGLAGALLTGVFASAAVGGTGGVLEGNWGVLGTQALGVGATIGYAAVMTFVIVKIIDALIGMRVDTEVEHEGLDGALHGEAGYTIGSAAAHLEMIEPAADEPAEAAPAIAPQAIGA